MSTILIISILLLLVWVGFNKTSKFGNYPFANDFPRFSDHYDFYSRTKHKYPFAGYSLYGYDDYYPVYRYYQKYGYPDAKYWSWGLLKYPWKVQSQLRPEYPVLASPDYVGLPSSFTRYHYQWPSPISADEKKIRDLGKARRTMGPKKL